MFLVKHKILDQSKTIKFNYKSIPYYFLFKLINKKNYQFFCFKIKKIIFNFFYFNNKFFYFFLTFKILKSIFTLFLNKVKDLIFGFFIELELKGLGYLIFFYKNSLIFDLSYSHFIGINVPINFVVKKFKNRLVLFSFDKDALLKFSKIIRNLKKIDIYKGKGIFVKGYKLTLKEIKKK